MKSHICCIYQSEFVFEKFQKNFRKFADYNDINLVYDILNSRSSLNNNEAKKLIVLFNNNLRLYESKKFGSTKGVFQKDNVGLIKLLKDKTGNDYSDDLIKP